MDGNDLPLLGIEWPESARNHLVNRLGLLVNHTFLISVVSFSFKDFVFEFQIPVIFVDFSHKIPSPSISKH